MNQQGITVLLNEQNANMALKVADYAYVLETGTLTLSGTGAELLTNEQVKAAYLGKSALTAPETLYEPLTAERGCCKTAP